LSKGVSHPSHENFFLAAFVTNPDEPTGLIANGVIGSAGLTFAKIFGQTLAGELI
jgi:hypothetical protein